VAVEELGPAAPGAAVSWMTLPEEVVGEGVGFVESPAAVRLTTVAGVPEFEFDAAGTLSGFAAGVRAGTLEEDVAIGTG